MTREVWVQHMFDTDGLLLPTSQAEVASWRQVHKKHLKSGCKVCLERKRTYDKQASVKARDNAYRSLGLVKVRGRLGGTYWE
jgi:hypothetical protein